MIGLDTNVLVRYFTQDDPEQTRKANAVIERTVAAGEFCSISCIVLCELMWVLRGAYGYEKPEVIEVLEKMLATSQFSIESKDLVRQALRDYGGGEGDFSDYLLGWRNHETGSEKTVTFDQNLKKSELFTVL